MGRRGRKLDVLVGLGTITLLVLLVYPPLAGWIFGPSLCGAVRDGRVGLVRLLLDVGASPNSATWDPDDSDSPNEPPRVLRQAASRGHTEIMALLLDHGAAVDGEADRQPTALMEAAWNGHAACVRLLIARGANVNARPQDTGSITALQGAAAHGDADIVRLLIEHGADVNAKEDAWPIFPEAKTPLALARESKHPAVIALLKQYGAKE